MECKKAYALIQDFIDGTLGSSDREAFGRHVEACPRCAEELEMHRSLAAFLGEMDLEGVPAGFGERVIGYLKSTGRILEPSAVGEREGHVWTRVFDWVPARLRAPAAAVAVVLIAI
ncbi:MAG: zf-HC2 domain-containing protein, partial [Candidatus Latescibacterota bacterium]